MVLVKVHHLLMDITLSCIVSCYTLLYTGLCTLKIDPYSFLLTYRCKNTELSEHYALLSRSFLNLEAESTAIIVLGRDVRKAMEKDQPA
jgi:hypothetical protein